MTDHGYHDAEMYAVDDTIDIPGVFIFDRLAFGPMFGINDKPEEGQYTLGMGLFGKTMPHSENEESRTVMVTAVLGQLRNPTEQVINVVYACLSAILPVERVREIMTTVVSQVDESIKAEEVPALAAQLAEDHYIELPKEKD